MPWSRRRLAVIVTTLLALVMAGAVAAKAEPQAQPSGPVLGVYAGAQLPNGDWVPLSPGLMVGDAMIHAPATMPVGPSAMLSLVYTVIPGGRADCGVLAGERDIEFRFKNWITYAADYYAPGVPSTDPHVPQPYDSTEIHAYGIHDVPGSDVDQYVYITYDTVCL
jgi:hypothetical protein